MKFLPDAVPGDVVAEDVAVAVDATEEVAIVVIQGHGPTVE
jgi:hypothetical protein